MSALDHLDQEILRDFITEAGELVESLDRNLVALEQSPGDAGLINAVFRAIHTIKGSGGFLALTPLTDLAHVAEDALNLLRQGHATLSADMMDLLLQAADVIRRQVDELNQGRMPAPADQPLLDALHRIGKDGIQRQAIRDADPAPAPAADLCDLQLPQAKMTLVEFMVEDLDHSIRDINDLLTQLKHGEPDRRRAVAARLRDQAGDLSRMVEFFEIAEMLSEISALSRFAGCALESQQPLSPAAHAAMDQIVEVLHRRTEALRTGKLLRQPTQPLIEQLDAALAAKTEAAPAAVPQEPAPARPATVEQTIRVDVDRLENMLNLVGELVLQKNRVLAMSRAIGNCSVDGALAEQFEQVASDLDRITADLQWGVMKTRLQPLGKVFGRYPRVVRDLERATGKKIELTIEGGDTEVDKTVLESIGDPLVHILRNSADHGLETPEDRTKAGKEEVGHIRILAQHEGSHVLIRVEDDGKGIDPQIIGRLAVERGLITAGDRESMNDRQIIQLIFAPGFSTAQSVSQISGRGVGMDVVRSNVAKLNGTIELESTPGKGTSVSIRLPLTLAIMPAMILRAAGDLMAVPLANTLEIVRLADARVETVNHQPVLRWRDQVVPMVDLAELFHVTDRGDDGGQFAVVVAQGDRIAALRIDHPVGQQDVVIKPLDRQIGRCPAIGSATVREDGGVSLILDISGLFEMIRKPMKAAA